MLIGAWLGDRASMKGMLGERVVFGKPGWVGGGSTGRVDDLVGDCVEDGESSEDRATPGDVAIIG